MRVFCVLCLVFWFLEWRVEKHIDMCFVLIEGKLKM